MGGLGSGRQFGKRTTNQVSSVTVKDLDAADRLHGSVRFGYSFAGKPVEHNVQLTQTACNYGGVRYWFKCSCLRQVYILYFDNGTCACRQCFNLSYKSEFESVQERAVRKADKIKMQLGWNGAEHKKPLGMHWRTYNRLTASIHSLSS
jgi:hypothetical protein